MRALLLGQALLLLAGTAACSSSSPSAGATSSPAAAADGAAGAATSPTASSGSRLRAKYVSGGDARQLVGFFDTQRQEDCTFQPAEGGRLRCLPTSLVVANGGAGGYSDPACQVGTAAAPTTGCATSAYVLTERYDEGTCTVAPFEIRKVLPASAPLYVLDGAGACSAAPAGAPPATNVLKLGDTVPWTDFAEGTVTTVTGALTERRIGSPDGASAPYGYQLDGLGTDCRFRVMADGAARCVPDVLGGPLLYSDSSCTEPSAVPYYNYTPRSPGCGGVGPSSDPLLWVADGSKGGDAYTSNVSCSGITGVYRVLGPSAAGVLYESATPSMTSAAVCRSGYEVNVESARSLGDDISGSLPSAPRLSSGSGRLVAALVLGVAADGASVLVPGFHDTAQDIDCTFETASDGKLRCLPTGPAAQLFFADGACTSTSQIAVLGPACSSAGAKRYGRTTSATCPVKTSVYTLGDTPKNYPGGGSAVTGPSRCAKVAQINAGYDAIVADPAQFAEGQLVTE